MAMRISKVFIMLLLITSPLFAMDWWGDDLKTQRRQAQAEREQKEFAEIKRKQEATEELKKYAHEYFLRNRRPLYVNILEQLKNGADPNITIRNSDGYQQPLIFFAIPNHPHIVKALLEAGANPNQKNNLGNTALIEAAHFTSEPIGKMLLEKGADPNIKNPQGLTALMFASYSFTRNMPRIQEFITFIRMLLDYNADLLATDSGGNNTLVRAISPSPLAAHELPATIEFVKFLLDAGADPNTGSPLPLIKAINQKSPELISLLLQAGANPNLRGVSGLTVLDLAQIKLERASEEEDKPQWQKIIGWLKNPKTAPRIAPKEKLTIKPVTQKKLEEYQINQEVEGIQASEEYKKSAQEAAKKYLEQLKKDK